MPLFEDRRGQHPRAKVSRIWWEMRHGPMGGLLIIALHQAVVCLMLSVDTYVLNRTQTVPVPGEYVWPIVFACGAAGALDIYLRRFRSRVDMAQALTLLAYGSRAMAVVLGGIYDRWTTQTSLSVAGWVALMLFTQRAWTEARDAL